MFIYNDIFFGPYFRRHILPRMDENNSLTFFCASFFGIDMQEQNNERLIDDDEE